MPAICMARFMKKTSLASSSTRRIVGCTGLSFSQLKPKLASSTNHGLDTDTASETFCSFTHNGQPDAGSFISALRVNPLEHDENALLIRGIDTNTVVLDP